MNINLKKKNFLRSQGHTKVKFSRSVYKYALVFIKDIRETILKKIKFYRKS